MPPGSNEGFGLLLGAGLGAFGGFLESRERRRAQEEFRRRQAAGITEARERTETRVGNLLDDPLIAASRQFIESSFAGGADSPLEEQFRRQLQVAQESRGTPL